jgi:hypothetical protein
MNKKKEYQKPAIKAIKLHHTRLLAGSSGQEEPGQARQFRGGFDDDE